MPATPPEAVVFDLGGVLVDWDPRYLYRTLLPSEEEVETFLAEVTTSAWNAEQDAGRSWASAVETLTAQHPHHAELIAAYRARWPEMLRGPISGTVDVLAELRVAGRPLFAVTNWSAETFPIARERFAFLSWFDGIVVSGEERLIKPDPAIFALLTERYGIDLTRTVFIDDVEANVTAATALGMIGLHFRTPDQLRRDLVALDLLSSMEEA